MTACNEEKKATGVDGSGQPGQPCTNLIKKTDRRTVIKKLAIGTTALAGISVLPGKWTSPLVEFGSLPAHATTSGAEALTSVSPETASQESVATGAGSSGAAGTGTGIFSLIFLQTEQPCASCGIWFDSAELVIEHSEGTFSKSQRGDLLIKKTSNKPGYFSADISSIPASATITSATLYMLLNSHEGIAASDNSSEIEVFDYSDGTPGTLVTTIHASRDIKRKGYSKSNPNVPIDFTEYAIGVRVL